MSKTCAVFIPFQTSLIGWDQTGILNRELYLYERHYNKYGTKFLIFTCGNEEDKKYSESFKGIEIYPLNISSWKDLIQKILFLPFKYRELFKSVDIIKIDQMWSAWIGLWFSVFFRKKLWARMGYEHYQLQCSQGTHFLKRQIVYSLSLLTYRKASFITVTTSNIKNFIIQTFKVSPEKIHIKANYIDTDLFQRKREPTIHDRILFIGRIDKVKNLRNALAGCNHAKMSLDIAGKGPLKNELIEFAKEIDADINFLGTIPNQKLPELIENYKYFILSSFHEGNPKSLLEAMSMGCVCITTNVPGIKEIIENEVNGLLADVTAESIGETIKKATESDTKTIERKAREYIIENNSLERLTSFENNLL